MQACKRQTRAFSRPTHFAYLPQKQLAIPLDREPNTRRKPREWRFVFHPWVHANNNVRPASLAQFEICKHQVVPTINVLAHWTLSKIRFTGRFPKVMRF